MWPAALTYVLFHDQQPKALERDRHRHRDARKRGARRARGPAGTDE